MTSSWCQIRNGYVSNTIPGVHTTASCRFRPYSYLLIFPLKSKVKILGKIKGQCQDYKVNIMLSIHIFSFQIKQAYHSWNAFFKLWTAISKNWISKSWVSSRSCSGLSILSAHIPFLPCRSVLPFLIYSDFLDLKNLRTRFSNSHPFCSISISSPILQIRLFRNLTLIFQGQGLDQMSRSHSGSNILMTHILSIPCQSAHPFMK